MQNSIVVDNNTQSWEEILFNQNSFKVFDKWFENIENWFFIDILEKDSLYEIVILLSLFTISIFAGKYLRAKLNIMVQNEKSIFIKFYAGLAIVAKSTIFFCLCLGVAIVCKLENIDSSIITICINLTGAWILIKLISVLTFSSLRIRFVAFFIWVFLALGMTNLLVPVLDMLEQCNVFVFNNNLSLLDILITFIICYLLLKIGSFFIRLLDNKIQHSKEFTDSTRQLIMIASKCITWFVIAIIALQELGLNLGALKVFSGAFGIGLGFGLKNILGNLVSGVILLLDKSITIGDVIVIGDVKGILTEYNARCATIITREGMEYLIPNEKLMTSEILNLTYSSPKVRVRIPVGISYESDVKKAMKILNDIATEDKRILKKPAPKTRVLKLGDSSILIEARVWVSDPGAGTGKLQSNLLLKVLERYKEEGISIPYPQRDVYLHKV